MHACWRGTLKPQNKFHDPLCLSLHFRAPTAGLFPSRRHPAAFRTSVLAKGFRVTLKRSALPANTILLLAIITSATGLAIWSRYPQQPADQTFSEQEARHISSRVPCVIVAPGMPSTIPPGRPGNLTSEQEVKLKELWEACLRIFGILPGIGSNEGRTSAQIERPSTPDSAAKKKRRFGGLLHHNHPDSDTEGGDIEDKYGQSKEFKAALSSMSPDDLRDSFWGMTKADHPDGLMLRYLRARKWNVQNALVMLISTMRWRSQDIHINDEIMAKGEGAALEDSKSNDTHKKKEGEDFLAQIRTGKSYLHGCDSEGRPICVVNVRLHRQGEQTESSLEKYTVYTIETGRLLLRPPVDTAVILFDMTNFSMANMDYGPVKFMIKCFEANYPESLGAVLVHKSPWIFQGIWTIIKGWLDPVVASKVHFTKDHEDLSHYISLSHIPHDLGGQENWNHKYTEPIENENEKMKDTATREKIMEERKNLWHEYEKITVDWCKGEKVKDIMEKRTDIAEKLRVNYWRLDPYIRARSLYDRNGMIKPDGQVDFYPKLPVTSPDDVD